jgi:hypothetical protein
MEVRLQILSTRFFSASAELDHRFALPVSRVSKGLIKESGRVTTHEISISGSLEHITDDPWCGTSFCIYGTGS